MSIRFGRVTKQRAADNRSKSSQFASRVFDRLQIERLPKKVASNWLSVLDGTDTIEKENLDLIAQALKKWAQQFGATHYAHWFQPLRTCAAEKHDSFLTWNGSFSKVIEELHGFDLFQTETDASSFPSGGLCSACSARGLVIWDPTSLPFLWEDPDGLTLYIPSLFLSWKGHSLDYKTPLLRSEQKISKEASRLLKMAKIEAKRVFSTLGPEQEYFAIDRDFYFSRPDLLLTGRTIYGRGPAKGQEMQDHYFASIPPRILAFMQDFEETAEMLGIPLKTRHNEVAPAQYEISPLYEPTCVSADHNLLLMEIMRKKAEQHGLACLFHEKPFAHLNGSGKHCNWSVATDCGFNFLDLHGNRFVFLVFLAAVLRGVYENAALLRVSIGSATNDCRLGGAEAPPPILSVYLGEELEKAIEKIIHHREMDSAEKSFIDLGLDQILPFSPALSDRNRTSFFAFTGNKFEFRAVGASQNVAWPLTILNSIVADSLHLILDEIEDARSQHPQEDLLVSALPVLKKHFKLAEPILFNGDNYSLEWQEEAKRRGLPNFIKSFHAFSVLRDPKIERVLQGVLSPDELKCRVEILFERYAKQINVECNLMIEIFRTQILPASLKYQSKWAKSVERISNLKIRHDSQQTRLEELSEHLNVAIEAVDQLESIKNQMQGLGWEAAAEGFCELALPMMETVRKKVDQLEETVSDELWPLPKYRDLLFIQ